jgi:transposase-like protein
MSEGNRQRREYDDQTKAAVMAALLAGQSVNSVAKEYRIPKGTVSTWKQVAQNLEGGRSLATQKSDESLDSLLLMYVKESLETLRAQVAHFRKPEWLDRQEASQAAVLHGVIADKTIRLLEAFGGAPES